MADFTAEEWRRVDAFVQCWGIKPGDCVLEPGCGSGRLTAVLAGLTGPTGRVVAFDCSTEFLRLAAQRHLPPHVTLHAAWAEALPLAPESFDHVVCFNVFPHFVPQAVITRRLAAALRPGGVVLDRPHLQPGSRQRHPSPRLPLCMTTSCRLRGYWRACCARPG